MGTYDALRVEQRGGDQYVQVPVWICSESQGVVYAAVGQGSAPILSGISESALTGYLQRFAGWTFSISKPAYTTEIPNVEGLRIAPPKQNSCCIFAEDYTVHGFEAGGWDFAWDQHRHDQMMVADWNDLWSPPKALYESGIALSLRMPGEQVDLPEPWTVCQGWGPNSGHTFTVVACHKKTGKVLILESNNAYGMNGPGFRGLGDLTPFLESGPPPSWWEIPAVPTWDQIRATYSSGIASAQLKVLTASLHWGRGF